MALKSTAFRLVVAALLVAVALVGLDVVDSARTVVVVGGYLWFAAFVAAALVIVFRTIRSQRAH